MARTASAKNKAREEGKDSLVVNRVEVIYVPVDKLVANPYNPNEQDAFTFNALTESIKEVGMVDPVDVYPLDKGWREHVVEVADEKTGQKYKLYTGEAPVEVIHGEHRMRACRYLGITEVPCIFHPDWEEDLRKFLTVRLNVLRGQISPQKFLKLVNDLRQKYKDEIISKMMGFARQEEFQKLVGQVKKALPKEIAEKLDEVDEEIETIEELSEALNRLFREYGRTLPYSFMFFTYGGQVHVLVRMTESLKKKVLALAEKCAKEGLNMADELDRRL